MGLIEAQEIKRREMFFTLIERVCLNFGGSPEAKIQ